jgi:hypothetical protein
MHIYISIPVNANYASENLPRTNSMRCAYINKSFYTTGKIGIDDSYIEVYTKYSITMKEIQSGSITHVSLRKLSLKSCSGSQS